MKHDYSDENLIEILYKSDTQEQFDNFYQSYSEFFNEKFGEDKKQVKVNIRYLIGYFQEDKQVKLAKFMINLLFPNKEELIGRSLVFDTDNLSFNWQNGEYVIDKIENEYRVLCHSKNNPERNNISINLLGECYLK